MVSQHTPRGNPLVGLEQIRKIGSACCRITAGVNGPSLRIPRDCYPQARSGHITTRLRPRGMNGSRRPNRSGESTVLGLHLLPGAVVIFD